MHRQFTEILTGIQSLKTRERTTTIVHVEKSVVYGLRLQFQNDGTKPEPIPIGSESPSRMMWTPKDIDTFALRHSIMVLMRAWWVLSVAVVQLQALGL